MKTSAPSLSTFGPADARATLSQPLRDTLIARVGNAGSPHARGSDAGSLDSLPTGFIARLPGRAPGTPGLWLTAAALLLATGALWAAFLSSRPAEHCVGSFVHYRDDHPKSAWDAPNRPKLVNGKPVLCAR